MTNEITTLKDLVNSPARVSVSVDNSTSGDLLLFEIVKNGNKEITKLILTKDEAENLYFRLGYVLEKRWLFWHKGAEDKNG